MHVYHYKLPQAAHICSAECSCLLAHRYHADRYTNVYKFKTIEIISVCIVLLYISLAKFGNRVLTRRQTNEIEKENFVHLCSIENPIFLSAISLG